MGREAVIEMISGDDAVVDGGEDAEPAVVSVSVTVPVSGGGACSAVAEETAFAVAGVWALIACDPGAEGLSRLLILEGVAQF